MCKSAREMENDKRISTPTESGPDATYLDVHFGLQGEGIGIKQPASMCSPVASSDSLFGE